MNHSLHLVQNRMKIYLQILETLLGCSHEELNSRLYLPKSKRLRERIPGFSFHYTPELFFQIQGKTIFTCPQERFTLAPGQTTLIRSGLSHHEKAIDGEEEFLNVVLMYLDGGFSLHIAGSTPQKKPVGITPHDFFQTEDRDSIIRNMEDLSASERLDFSLRDGYRYSLFRAILIVLQDVILRGPVIEKTDSHSKIALCKGYVQSNLQESSLSVLGIAGYLGYSADYLTRLFRKETGKNLTDFISEKRIERAKSLLSYHELNVSEIAWNCGYADPSYFTRVFKKATNLSPKEYRFIKIK